MLETSFFSPLHLRDDLKQIDMISLWFCPFLPFPGAKVCKDRGTGRPSRGSSPFQATRTSYPEGHCYLCDKMLFMWGVYCFWLVGVCLFCFVWGFVCLFVLTNSLIVVTALEELNHPALGSLSQARFFTGSSLWSGWPWLVCGSVADREVLPSNKPEIATKEMLRAEGATWETNTESTLGAAGNDCLPVWTLVHSWVAQFMEHIRELGSYCCFWGQSLLLLIMAQHLRILYVTLIFFLTVLRCFKLKPGIIRVLIFSPST